MVTSPLYSTGGSVSSLYSAPSSYSPNRMGLAAAAMTAPGTPPAYGQAADLASLPLDHDQFVDMTRAMAQIRQQALIDQMAQGIDLKQRESELEMARNYEEHGLSMENEAFSNTDDDDENWLQRFGNDLQTGFRMARNEIGQGIGLIGTEISGDNVPSFGTYRARGGMLTEEEYAGFKDETKQVLYERLKAGEIAGDVAGAPGIKQALSAFYAGYRGLSTGAGQVADLRGRLFGPETTGSLSRDLAPFFSADGWAKAWRESEERHLGNALIDNLMSPEVEKSTLDRWRRTNAWYQMSSVGTEVAATWYADGGVFAARGLGNFGRLARNELPLENNIFDVPSKMHGAIRQAQQGREIIAVRTPPARAYASWRAQRLLDGQKGVEDFARHTDFATFAQLPMFAKRQSDGIAAAKALHIAANSTDHPELLDITWGALNGDKRAFAEIERMKVDPSNALKEFGPNAKVLADAYDATKSRIPQLEQEIKNLNATAPNSPFHRWEIHADKRVKEEEILRAKEALNAYGDEYLQWLAMMGTKGPNKITGDAGDPFLPSVSRYKAPSQRRWAETDTPFEADGIKHRLFMKDQFGRAHQKVIIPKAAYVKKTGTASMHDLDGTFRSVNRYFDQLDAVLQYAPAGARESVIEKLVDAETPFDRYKVLYEMEQEHLVQSLAGKLGISFKLAHEVFRTVERERTASINGVMSGKGQIYSSSPSLKARLATEGSGVKLVSEADDEGMVTFELMDNGKLTTVTTHESALVARVEPIDPTQTPNYYTPADVRRLYLEMKRNADVLHAIDADPLAWTKAKAMQTIDRIGTTFYNLWKPAQLWRFGWPQRVLMDEGLRAAAIFGPMYWITGPGGEQVGTVARNAIGRDLETLSSVVTGRARPGRLNLGAGPLTANSKHAPNPFLRDKEQADSVKLPASRYPKVNKSRLDRMQKRNAARGQYMRSKAAMDANYREAVLLRRERDGLMGRVIDADPENLPEDLVKAFRTNLTAIEKAEVRADAARHRVSKLAMAYEDEFGTAPDPLGAIKDEYAAKRAGVSQGYIPASSRSTVPLVFDPVDGAQLMDGYVVPIPGVETTKFRNPEDVVPDNMTFDEVESLFDRNNAYWFERNAEMLARTNVRLMVTPDGEVTPAFYFRGNGARGKAMQALRDIADSTPLNRDVPHMWDVQRGESYFVKDRNDMSQAQEALLRYFYDREQIAEVEGRTPGTLRGEQVEDPAFHGTAAEGGLPMRSDGTADLRPREDVYPDRGNMVGPGFYTTVDRELAEEYAYGGLYKIRDSRTGQNYEVFDLDKNFTKADLNELKQWLRDQATDDGFGHMTVGEAGDWLDDLIANVDLSNENIRLMSQGDYWPFRTTRLKRKGQVTWGNFYESFPEGPRKKYITRFLEERRNAGALTHRGGAAAGREHQVYVWLDPENLEVVPAYGPTGKYEHLQNWLAYPGQREMPLIQNAVPESRIVRIGRRNPMIRDLHTTHAKAEARRAQLRAEGRGTIKDRELVDLVMHEQSLMEALGLEYAGRGLTALEPDSPIMVQPRPANAWGQDWYEVKDTDRFDRMLSEARGYDKEIGFAAALRGEQKALDDLDAMVDRELDVEEFDHFIDDPALMLARGIRKKFGAGHTTLTAPDGSEVSYANIFEGHLGELTKGFVSSAKAVDDLTANHGGGLNFLRRQMAGHRVYNPPEFTPETMKKGTKEHREAVTYFHQWADMVNNQIGNSPIWQKMLKGWSDERIVKWLDETPQGYNARKEILDDGASTELWVNEHRAKLNYYLPSRKLQRLLGKGRLSPSDLRRNVHDSDLPDVFGPDVEALTQGWTKKIADNIWKALGTIPIDTMSRHPFAKASFDMHMRAQINTAGVKDWLTDDDLNRMAEIARKRTLEDVRKRLFDLTDATNMTDALRFVAPFWNAQFEAIQKWLSIVVERPETMVRFFNGQASIYRNMIVVDEEGNEVNGPSGTREGGNQPRGMFGLGVYHPTDKVIFRIPEFARRGPLEQALQAIGKVGIPLGSANTVLQGEMPLIPGTGPFLTVPVDQMLKMLDDNGVGLQDEVIVGDVYRWLFPIGRPGPGFKGVMESISPGSARRLISARSAEDDIAKANLGWMVGRELIAEADRKGEKRPSNADIAKATNSLWALRAFTSFVAPVQVDYRPKHQYYLDQAHRYREEFGAQWFDRFVQDFGKEYSLFTISSSNSLTGTPPTLQGMEDWASNKELIAKYPQWGAAIVSPDAYSEDYNQDAYRAQFEINLGPLDSRNLRDVRDVNTRMAEHERRLGWMEYRKFNAALNAELYARGLTNIQQSGAEDLSRLKAAFTNELGGRYPAWREDMSTFTMNVNQRMDELRSFAFNKEFDTRPDMQGARQYLMLREQATELLDLRYSVGGSRSLQAGENADVRAWFYDNVGQLVLSNPAFGEFYSRYLDGDTLQQGGG